MRRKNGAAGSHIWRWSERQAGHDAQAPRGVNRTQVLRGHYSDREEHESIRSYNRSNSLLGIRTCSSIETCSREQHPPRAECCAFCLHDDKPTRAACLLRRLAAGPLRYASSFNIIEFTRSDLLREVDLESALLLYFHSAFSSHLLDPRDLNVIRFTANMYVLLVNRLYAWIYQQCFRFEKSLYDLIRGLRNHKGDEIEYIQSSIKECRAEVRSQDMGSLNIRNNRMVRQD